MDHGASGGHGGGHGTGHVSGHQIGAHHHGGYDGGTATGTQKDISGIVKKSDCVEMHIQSHGLCEVRYKLMQLVSKLDLVKIDIYRPNLIPEDRTVDRILPDNAWVDPNKDPQPPISWYPCAKGKTRLWREFFHIGKREGWLFKGPLKPNFESRVYLEIECVTRSYIETGDCQTDLVIWVRPLHKWSPYTVSWQANDLWVSRHMAVAEALATQLYCVVRTECPPPADAAEIRERKRNHRRKSAVSPSPGDVRQPVTRPVPPDRVPHRPVHRSDEGMSGADIDKLFPPEPGDQGVIPGGGSGGGTGGGTGGGGGDSD